MSGKGLPVRAPHEEAGVLAKVVHDLEPFRWVFILAALDPVVIGIGLWMGWHADQAGKLFLAGLAACLAGITVSFLLRFVGIPWFEGGFAFGGAHALSRFVTGCAWAGVGYAAQRVFRPRTGADPSAGPT
jgi:hypothetical protein